MWNLAGVLDVLVTYWWNTPDDRGVASPDFAWNEARVRDDPEAAFAKFKHWVRSVFGQRQQEIVFYALVEKRKWGLLGGGVPRIW